MRIVISSLSNTTTKDSHFVLKYKKIVSSDANNSQLLKRWEQPIQLEI